MKYNTGGQLEKLVKELISKVSKVTLKEWESVRTQENFLYNFLLHDEARLRGIKLSRLTLDTSYFKSVKGEIEIQLLHDYPLSSTARSFRRGKLVDILLSGSDQNSLNPKR